MGVAFPDSFADWTTSMPFIFGRRMSSRTMSNPPARIVARPLSPSRLTHDPIPISSSAVRR